MKYRALVADDEPMIRRGIISFLKGYDDFEVVAEAEDGQATGTVLLAGFDKPKPAKRTVPMSFR